MITLHVNKSENMLNSFFLTGPRIFINSKQLYACFIILYCAFNKLLGGF